MADLDRIERIVDGTPYMRRHYADLLAELCARLEPRHIVEIGTFHGVGTCYLAELARDFDGHVTTIDLPWTLDKVEHEPKAEDLLARCGLTNATVIRRPDGAEGWFLDYFADDHREPLDLCYVDGGHTWGPVVAQFAMSYRALRLGGWSIFDDIANAKYPEVGLAWRSIIKPNAARTREHGNWGFAMKG